MDEREKAIRLRLRDDLPHYAGRCLKIRAKEAVLINGRLQKVIPFTLNKAQQYLHERLEEQKAKTGRVRALILKGRQQGCSTYVGARFYQGTTHRRGVKTFILTHRDDATNNLFGMVRRFYEHTPEPVKPSTSYSNRRELVFDKLDSAYGLGTAGAGGVGRSDTIDFFHGSEVAFWANPDEIRTGIMQAAEGAEEIILESTGNGFDPMFYPMWQDAVAGRGKYIAVFIPWFWQAEYQEPVPEGFRLTDEESAYMRAHGLTVEQMVWRRNKIIELKDPLLFQQEYPASAVEAFQVTGHEGYIKPEIVLKARKEKGIAPHGSRIVGVDPAREGKDRTSIISRQGRVAYGLEKIQVGDSMHIVGRCKALLDEKTNPVEMLFIDRGGEGGAIYDRLKEMGYGRRVRLVNFGSTEQLLNRDKYKNKRAEMWGETREWLSDPGGAMIPDDDELQADLCAPGYRYDSLQRVILESKEDMKARGMRSPDCGDALALTFAFPVRPQAARAARPARANTEYKLFGHSAKRDSSLFDSLWGSPKNRQIM